MAIIRERRKSAIQGLYSSAALIYLVLGGIVVATSRLPGVLPDRPGTGDTQLDRLAPLLFLGVATLVLWRAHRKLSILLMLHSLYRGVVFLLNGLGNHLGITTDATMPEAGNWADPQAVQAFFEAELATDTPFYETASLSGRAAIRLAEALPLPESMLAPVQGFVVQPAQVAFLNALLLLIVALGIWRAVRHHK
jgi:hypothetical protein